MTIVCHVQRYYSYYSSAYYKTDPQILLQIGARFLRTNGLFYPELEKIFPIYRLENENWSKEVHLEQGSPFGARKSIQSYKH